MKKRERNAKQGWAKHRRNLDGGPRLIGKRLRKNAKENIKKEVDNRD